MSRRAKREGKKPQIQGSKAKVLCTNFFAQEGRDAERHSVSLLLELDGMQKGSHGRITSPSPPRLWSTKVAAHLTDTKILSHSPAFFLLPSRSTSRSAAVLTGPHGFPLGLASGVCGDEPTLLFPGGCSLLRRQPGSLEPPTSACYDVTSSCLSVTGLLPSQLRNLITTPPRESLIPARYAPLGFWSRFRPLSPFQRFAICSSATTVSATFAPPPPTNAFVGCWDPVAISPQPRGSIKASTSSCRIRTKSTELSTLPRRRLSRKEQKNKTQHLCPG